MRENKNEVKWKLFAEILFRSFSDFFFTGQKFVQVSTCSILSQKNGGAAEAKTRLSRKGRGFESRSRQDFFF